MRAFLSHSSLDKGFVDQVAEALRPGTYELDSLTFDAGLINSQAIIRALERSDLFVLFLSKQSVRSSYVDFESLLGLEFFAKGRISRFLTICIDDDAFSLASQNVTFFNAVRKSTDPEEAARLIQGHLVRSDINDNTHPFVGREEDMRTLEAQISDLSAPLVKGLFISGNRGIGRRTLARHFYQAQFPHVRPIFPQINIGEFDGLEELYRTVLITLRPSMRTTDLRIRIDAFAIAPEAERQRQIAQLLNSLLPVNEASIVFDDGGILTDAGGFAPELLEVFARLEAKPHPPVILVSHRKVLRRFRPDPSEIAYADISVLEWDTAARLISRLLRERDITAQKDDIDLLVQLSDRHPYNIYRLIDDVSESGVAAFLARSSDFVAWKHSQSSEYIADIQFTEGERKILCILTIAPQLDFSSIVEATSLSPEEASTTLQHLDHLRLIDIYDDRFSISPALRVAVERDSRLRLPASFQQTAIQVLATSLMVRIEAGTAPIALLDSAIITTIDSGSTPSSIASALMLPSHYVKLSKYYYDRGNWRTSLRYGRSALDGQARLSLNGLVAACRFVCLSSARLRDDLAFDASIAILEKAAKNDWARSNVAFLKGFRLRNRGNLLAAEKLFQEADELAPGNASAIRELAAIALTRGHLDKAETLARNALRGATRNPFFVDMLLAVLIRKHGNATEKLAEIDDLFNKLETVGEEGGRSFYTTRKAEFEHRHGDNDVALSLINDALNKTPSLFEPQLLYAEILIKKGNITRAGEAIERLRRMVYSSDSYDRGRNRRPFLEVHVKYLTEIGRYDEAKIVLNDPDVFLVSEIAKGIKDIETIQSYKQHNKR